MASPLGVEGRETLITLVETDDKYPNTSVGGSEPPFSLSGVGFAYAIGVRKIPFCGGG